MFVSVDVSKKKHDICIYDRENEKYISFQTSNSRDGLKNLSQRFLRMMS